MGTQPPPQKGAEPSPIFGPCLLSKRLDGSRRHLSCLGPGHIVLDGDPASLVQKGTEPPIFGRFLLWPNGGMQQDATWFGGRPQAGRLCVRWGPSPIPKKGRSRQFSAHVYCGQAAAWIKMPRGSEVGLGLRDIMLEGTQLPFH